MKTGLYGIVASSKTRVRCVFCGVHIPKATKCIEQHTNGMKHQENIELLVGTGISFKDGILHCKPCKCVLAEDESVVSHIEGDHHATWMAAIEDLIEGEFINLDPYLNSPTEKDVKCEVCKCSIICTLLALELHVNSFDHRAKLAEKLKPLNGILPVDNDVEVWCKVCNIYIENTVDDIMAHIDDNEEHTVWFSEIEDLIEDQDISIEDYLTNEHQNKAFCSKCNVPIVCTTERIADHVNSDVHLNSS